MTCVYPRCVGPVRLAGGSGFCEVCRLPVGVCGRCGEGNRSAAAFCRICGAVMGEPAVSALDAGALGREPQVSAVPQALATEPEAGDGFLWAVGEGGDLYRLNPYGKSGLQVETQMRMWEGRQAHAFAVRAMRRVVGSGAVAERCGLVATGESVAVVSLATGRVRRFGALAGERFLVEARDRFERVEGEGRRVYLLSSDGREVGLAELDVETGERTRQVLAPAGTAVCGPVLVPGSGGSAVVMWSAGCVWTWMGGEMTRHELPAGTELWTRPSPFEGGREGGVRLPLGMSPARVVESGCYLPGVQFGGAALVYLRRLPSRWEVSVVPVREDGTLSAGDGGRPLLSTTGKLLRCSGQSVQMLLADEQIAPRFAAWEGGEQRVYVCEASYGGRKQWLKAKVGGEERPVSWGLAGDEQLKECCGWWKVGSGLAGLMLVEGRGLRTEFVAWV